MRKEDILSSIQSLNANKDSTTWDQRTFLLAPHKPFLLLSIIDGIESGWITDSKITLSQDLVETFFRYWNQIMGEERKTTIALPFYHMQSEPFWELSYKDGKKPYKNSPSLGGLMDRVAYAQVDDQLFSVMRDEDEKKVLTKALLQTYFADEVHGEIQNIHQINTGAYRYVKQLELLAAEPFRKYHAENDHTSSYTWQRKQQRRHGFRLKVRESYDHRCAICRAKVITPNGQSLIEGAHIIPWSESKNDDPRNGIALCKTHHWMFDTYLLTVLPDYRIKLSLWLKQEGEKIDQTLALDKKEIMIPEEQRFLPSEEALEEHSEQFVNN
ncbi:HNH endonuclease [Fodinibius sp.]|uniref:HNH endonuclease n=1 Tax=Fodinibius sp. TaxID=1872440 RepID=UPI003566EEF4